MRFAVVYFGTRTYKENELENELREKYSTNVAVASKNNQALSQFIRRSIGTLSFVMSLYIKGLVETKGEPNQEKDKA